MQTPRYLVKTLGCKANLYDSQLIEAELRRRGWTAASEEGEPGTQVCIINSCTVTDEADRQSRKLAARLARLNPGAKVVVTGCAAEVDPERLAASTGIHYVVGNQSKPALVDLVLKAIERDSSLAKSDAAGMARAGEVLGAVTGYEQMVSRHPIDREWPAPEGSFHAPELDEAGADLAASNRTRAFLKIQEGCNSFCTYCVIPYGRGPSRSLGIAEIVQQINTLVARGIREVVITGTNIGDYGTDWQPAGGAASAAPAFDMIQLEKLFETIMAETKLERLRVSSLDPVEITPGLLSLMAREPRFCPHFHVSLQSPHSRILKLMKRKYAHEQVSSCLERVAAIPSPAGGVFVGMDVITGFPGETDEDFEWGFEKLKELPWSRLHVFPFSERSGTPATRLPNVVPQAKRVERARKLRELSLSRLETVHRDVLESHRHSGRPIQGILLESRVKGPDGTENWFAGYSPNYLRVLVPVAPERELSNVVVAATPESILVDRNAGDVAFIARLSG